MQYILFITLLLGAVHPLRAQIWYEFKFNWTASSGIIPVQALMQQQAEDMAVLRMRYMDPETNQDCLAEVELFESDVLDARFRPMPDRVYLKSSEPEFLLGQGNKFKPVFLFRLNRNQVLEPSALMKSIQPEALPDASANFSWKLIPANGLTEKLLSRYYFEDEPIRSQLLSLNQKDITPAEKTMTIHMVLVGNTLDKKIGTSCKMDLNRTQEVFTSVARFLGIRTKIVRLEGAMFGKKKMMDAVQALKPVANKDIVVFYYTGHGFRMPSDRYVYPHLDMTYRPDQDYKTESVSIRSIYDVIKAKGARLNLVLSDCCNSYVGAPLVTAPWFMKKKSIPALMYMQNVRKLFLDPRPVSILAAAADTTQRAAGNQKMGGFFSYFFKSSVEANCIRSSVKPSWYTILEDTKNQTSRKANRTYCDTPYVQTNICYQTPIYEVD